MINTTSMRHEGLNQGWQQASAGDQAARDQWQVVEGHGWEWGEGGVLLRQGDEWSALRWAACGEQELRALGRFTIELRVRGDAGLAGLSVGPYKDFLVPLAAGVEQQLQLSVDGIQGIWALRIDGVLVGRAWWDSAIRTCDDLLKGALAFKAHRGRHVRFTGLAIRPAHTTCQLSVVLTCQRFLQRLRVTLRSWCEQDLPFGSYEVLIVNPASPDGTHDHLAAVARSYPHVAVREIAVDPALALNKGAMINQAVQASRGAWTWLTDADCLWGPHSATLALAHIARRPERLFFAERRYLPEAQTDALLAGRLDGQRDFAALAGVQTPRGPDSAPWGYSQIVPRRIIAQLPYQEDINHFAYSDNHFVEICAKRGLRAEVIPALFCLHLDHPFAWYGNDMYL